MRHRNEGVRAMATVCATAALGLAFTLAPSAQGQLRWHVNENAPVGGNGVTCAQTRSLIQAECERIGVCACPRSCSKT